MYCVSQLWHDTFLHQFRYTLTFMCINMHCIQAVFPHLAMIIYFVNNYTLLLYSPYAVSECNLMQFDSSSTRAREYGPIKHSTTIAFAL